MDNKNVLIECVPNFSNGRDKDVIEKIVDPFRQTEGVKLLDYSQDKDHNRAVVTVIGSPEGLKKSIVEAVGIAKELIDLRNHTGEHPRMGATDVIPFIPILNADMDDCDALAKDVAKAIADSHDIPIYLYEKSASVPARRNLAKVRKGQFEGMAEKMRDPDWKPDFGPDHPHESAGVTAVGARMPLVAYNVNLDTDNLEIADYIAKRVRHIGGGMRFVKAMGVELKERGIVQVSMNMTDYTKSHLYQIFELIKIEAKRYGVNVIGSEIIGLTPMQALVDTAEYYLGLENFSAAQIIESRLLEE